MAYGKKNIVKLDPFDYNIGLLGEGGIGKTTLIKEMCESHLPDNGYLFVECGKEDGADALSDINHINCPDVDSEYNELNNSVGFDILLEDILCNKETEYPNLKTVIIDTYDELRKILIPVVIKKHNRLHPDKKTISIKSAFGGFMAGDDMVDEMLLDKLWSLKKVGVHFILIGHTRLHERTDNDTGATYVQLSSNVTDRSFNTIKTKLHFLGLAHIDRTIVRENVGKKTQGKVKSEVRKITFRDDNYSLDSKSRFAEIVEECEFSADAFYDAMIDAIKKEASKGKGGLKASEKETKSFEEKEKQQAKEYSSLAKENNVDEEKNEELKTIVKARYSEASDKTKDKIKEIMNEYNFKKFSDDNIPTIALEKIVELLKE